MFRRASEETGGPIRGKGVKGLYNFTGALWRAVIAYQQMMHLLVCHLTISQKKILKTLKIYNLNAKSNTHDAKKISACSMVPWKAILPLASSTTWWNSSKTPEAGWCTEQTTSLPPIASFRRRDTTAAAAQLSRPVVGSSQNKMGGSLRS